MAKGGNDVEYTVGADTSSYDESISGLATKAQQAASSQSKTWDSVATSFGRIGTALTVGVTAPLVAVGLKAASTALDFTKLYESAQNTFTHMLGSAEAGNALYKSLLGIAKGSAFAQEHLIAAGQTLVGMGVSSDNTTKYMQAATDAVSAFGGSGADLENVAGVFGKVTTQGKLMGDDLNQFATQGINALAILADQYGVSTAEMKDMVSAGIIPADEALGKLADGLENGYTDATGHFVEGVAGMASELKSGSLTGALDSLNSSFRSFSLELIGINPTLQEGDAGYEESAAHMQTLINAINLINEILPKLASLFGDVTDGIYGFISFLTGTDAELSSTGTALDTTSGALEKFNHWLDTADDSQLRAVGNAIAFLVALGPGLKILSVTMKGLGTAVTVAKSAFTAVKGAAESFYLATLIGAGALKDETASAIANATAKKATTGADAALTTAETLRAVATGVATVATNVATTAVVALFTAIEANPIGAFLVIVAALAAGVVAVGKAMADAGANAEAQTVAYQEQSAAVDKAQQSYDNAVASQGANSDAAIAAAASLEEEKGKLDSVTMSYQQFRDSVDESLKTHEDVIKSVAEGAKDLTEAQQLYTDATNDQTDISNKLKDAQAQLDAETQKNIDSCGMLGNTQVWVSAKQTELEHTVSDLNDAYNETQGAVGDAAAQVDKFAKRSDNLRAAMLEVKNGTLSVDEATEKYGLTEEEVAEYTDDMSIASQDAAVAMSDERDAILELVSSNSDLSRALDDSGMSASEFADNLEAVGMSADDFKSMMDDISDSTMNAFERMDEQEALSMQNLIDNLNANAEQTRAWGDNLNTIMERTGSTSSSSFMKYITDLGPEYAGTIANIANASDEELGALVTAWANSGDATFQAAAEAAGMSTQAYAQGIADGSISISEAASQIPSDQADAITANGADVTEAVSAVMEQAGTDSLEAAMQTGSGLVTGIAQGMTANAYPVYEAVNSIADAMNMSLSTVDMTAAGMASIATFGTGLTVGAYSVYAAMQSLNAAISSNIGSIDLSGAGYTVTASLASGISAGSSAATGATMMVVNSCFMTAMGASALMQAPGQLGISYYAQGIRNGTAQAQQAAQAAANSAVQGASSRNSEFKNIGQQMANGIAEGIRSNSYAVGSAMSNIVQAALQRGREEAGIHSPSTLFRDQMGVYIAQGVAEGINQDAYLAVAAIEDMNAQMLDAADVEIGAPSSITGSMVSSATSRIQASSAAANGYGELVAMVGSLYDNLGGIIANNTQSEMVINDRVLGRTVRSAL